MNRVCAPVFVLLIVWFGLSFGQFHKRDDFQTKRSDWIWITYGPGSSIGVSNGCAYLNLTNPVGSEYCNTELVSRDAEHQSYGTLQTRLRTTAMFNGSRGWGWWDRRKDQVLTDFDVAWVMQSKDGGNPLNDWFRWGHCNGPITNLQWWGMPEAFDPTQWHTYRMDWSPSGAKLYIDGALFKDSPNAVPNNPMSLDIWVDNGYLTYMMQGALIPAGQSFAGTSSIQVDYVEMYSQDPGQHRDPDGPFLLWERPNAFAPGGASARWKDYSFTSPGGPVLFVATAKTESYGTWSDDDDLRFQIDDEDLGWDSPESFNGAVENGDNAARTFIRNLPAGQHQLSLFSDMSPLLYDVVAVGMTGGGVLLDTAIQGKASGGSENTLAEISFESRTDGEVIVLASASAESGDALRLVLNENDSGWGGSQAVLGSVLLGDAKTVVLRRWLPAGLHILKVITNGTPVLHHVSAYGNVSPGIYKPIATPSSTEFRAIARPRGDIELRFAGFAEATCSLHDLLGRQLERIAISGNKAIFSARTLPAGIYIVEVLTHDNRFRKAVLSTR